MKNKITIIFAAAVISMAVMACSFSTAKISSFNFGKNDSANPPATSFDIADKIYAVAVVSGSASKQKMRFKVTVENIAGKTKGEELFSKEIEFEGSRPVYLALTVPSAGEYNVESTLLGEDGKEQDKKSGTFKVTGEAKAPAAPAPAADSDDASDKDEKQDDK